MDILQMTYFRDAARLENFSLVAKKNYVAQSSVSRAIANLEKELGVKLFLRRGNAIELNEYGRLLLPEIEAALSHIESAGRVISNRQRQIVRVSTSAGTAATVQAMAAFRDANPDIELQFNSSLKVGTTPDLYISDKPKENADAYRYLELFSERYMIALPQSNPLSSHASLSVEDLRGIPVVGLSSSDALYRQMLPYFEAHRYTPEFLTASGNPTTIAEYVRCGFGIAFFPERSWARIIEDGVVGRPFSDFDLRRSIYLYWEKKKTPTPAAQRFIDFCAAYYRSK